MQKQKKVVFKSSICFLLLFVCLLLFIPIGVYYADSTYSNVLEDLQTDETFNINDYPLIENDYSLQVIQIAESIDNELLVYVYQPSGRALDFRASSINFSTSINDSFSPKNYSLTFINSNGVFFKYKVNDFKILPDLMRYYSIVSIFRPFNVLIDEQVSGGNTVNEVSYEVGKLFTAVTVDNQVTYSCLDTETILVTDKYIGFVRYSNGFTLYNQACDSHYVAFNTDKPMDKLMEVDIGYIRQDVTYHINLTGSHRYSEGELITENVKLSDIDKGNNSAHGWFATQYNWQRIEKVTSFIADSQNNLTNETKEILRGKQWVLRFYESDYQLVNSATSYEYVTEVTDVTLLRLKFETNGVVYNLGVVDNKQSGDLTPDNNPPEPWWKKIVKLLLLILILVVLVPLLPWIFVALFQILKYIFLGLWKLISLPFNRGGG